MGSLVSMKIDYCRSIEADLLLLTRLFSFLCLYFYYYWHLESSNECREDEDSRDGLLLVFVVMKVDIGDVWMNSKTVFYINCQFI